MKRYPLSVIAAPRAPDRNIALDLVRVTEAAALAAARHMGRGDPFKADDAAVAAIRHVMRSVPIDGAVVISEGAKDQKPMLFTGERVGVEQSISADVAIDPIDGSGLTAMGQENATSAIVVSDRGTLFDPGPSCYMEKLVVGANVGKAVDLSMNVGEIIHTISAVTGKTISQVTAVVLARPRHASLIQELRDLGVRLRLIQDGDIAAALSTCIGDARPDLLLGVGGTAEGIIAAAGVKCLGGHFQARFAPQDTAEEADAIFAGLDLSRIYSADDLVRGENCFFAATGITSGTLLDGVEYGHRWATTHSLVMRSATGTVRNIYARHLMERVFAFLEALDPNTASDLSESTTIDV